MRIVIVGAGYVGLVSGACFADLGFTVCCVEKDARRLQALRAGGIPIYEPGLEEVVARNVAAGRLAFSDDLATEVPGADTVFLAVGTPTRAEDGDTDLSYVFAAVTAIAEVAEDGLVIVTKSTVPVATGDEIERIVRGLRPDLQFAVVSNPEFLREGTAIGDFMKPDRIVIGAEEDWAGERVALLYAPLVAGGAPLIHTRRASAEVIKYAANAFLATKISFINEMADFCEATGADIAEVARAIGLDPRVGRQFLRPGPGYGGSCLPKDGRAILQSAGKRSVKLRVIEGAVAANDARPGTMAARIVAALGGDAAGRRIAVLGLTFKPDTDDVRESPALAIVALLQRAGAVVAVHDPKGMEASATLLSGVEWCADAYAAAAGADAVVLATEWREFVELDFDRLRAAMRGRVFVDLRNAVSRERLAASGLVRFGIGEARQGSA